MNTPIFWAQALDNQSPGIIKLGDEIVSPSEMKRKQEAVAILASVSLDGKLVYEEDHVRVTADWKQGLLHISIPCTERDVANRIAPIACCFGIDDLDNEDFSDSVISAIEHFAHEIGRTIEDRRIDQVRGALSQVKKNDNSPSRTVLVFILAALLLAIAIGYLVLR